MDGVSTALAQQLTVSEDLPQTESELLLFIGLGDALHLRDAHNAVQFPRQIEVRLVWARGTRRPAA